MSLFCITQSVEDAGIVKKDYDSIFPQKSSVYQLSNRLFLTAAPGFREKIAYKMVGNDQIFVFGTIFCESGFTDGILEQVNDCAAFMEALKGHQQNYYGHYIVVGFQAEKQRLEIITDRVGCLNVYYKPEYGSGCTGGG